jgi:Integrase core domain
MRSHLSFRSKRELLLQIAPRYREASPALKTVILDEFVAATGYARKYAIRLLSHPEAPKLAIERPRPPHYGPEVQQALHLAWTAANHICAKRLIPFLPTLVESLEHHGHLHVSEESRAQLLLMSPATADRILQPYRKQERHGISTTRSGTLLKKQIPVRTFSDWNEAKTGFMEADLVAHCGTHADGSYLYTLRLPDIATGWTECLPLLNRSQESVVAALKRTQQLLPFPLLGIDTDNGAEFINMELLSFCEQEHITFTRGRPRKSNDQCYVEQKNGQIVRQVVGYDRFAGELAYRQLTELYRALRVYVNCCRAVHETPIERAPWQYTAAHLRSGTNADATAQCFWGSSSPKAARTAADHRGGFPRCVCWLNSNSYKKRVFRHAITPTSEQSEALTPPSSQLASVLRKRFRLMGFPIPLRRCSKKSGKNGLGERGGLMIG